MSKLLAVKNWSKFQHFKDRNPPWIKLHKTIIDDRDINVISDCSFRVLVFCWLLASEDKDKSGKLPDVDTIAFRTRIDKSKIINALQELKNFIIQDDINAISERYQVDAPETETETEGETEGETEAQFPLPPEALGSKPKSFKQWTLEDLQEEATKNNADNLLSTENLCEFVGYWSQKTASGKMLFTTEKTFDVRRRMNTASKLIYNKPEHADTSRNLSTSFANQKPASYFRGKEQVKLEF